MKFQFKDLEIDSKKFVIKYLVEVEEYELAISDGIISIGVFYFPDYYMSINEAQNTLDKYKDKLLKEVYNVIQDNSAFYDSFEVDGNFKGTGGLGGRNDFGKEVAELASTVLYLKKINE